MVYTGLKLILAGTIFEGIYSQFDQSLLKHPYKNLEVLLGNIEKVIFNNNIYGTVPFGT